MAGLNSKEDIEKIRKKVKELKELTAKAAALSSELKNFEKSLRNAHENETLTKQYGACAGIAGGVAGLGGIAFAPLTGGASLCATMSLAASAGKYMLQRKEQQYNESQRSTFEEAEKKFIEFQKQFRKYCEMDIERNLGSKTTPQSPLAAYILGTTSGFNLGALSCLKPSDIAKIKTTFDSCASSGPKAFATCIGGMVFYSAAAGLSLYELLESGKETDIPFVDYVHALAKSLDDLLKSNVMDEELIAMIAAAK